MLTYYCTTPALPALPAYQLNPQLEQSPIYSWILQYLAMLSTTEQAVSFYQSILASPQMLANGYHLIRDFLFAAHHNRTHTLLALMHPQVPVLMLVLNVYPTEVFPSAQVSPQEKEETRQFLVNLLTSELLKTDSTFNAKAVGLLFSFLHKIHNVEGFHEWVGLYEQALERLVENQSSRFGFFLLNLLKEADDRVGEFSRHVLGLIVGSSWVPVPEQQLEILYYCYKSMAMLNDTDPETIEAYVTQHIEPTIAYLCKNMRQSVRAMKFSLKILTILLGDYQVACSKSLLHEVEDTSQALIVQYINYLNQGCTSTINTDIELEQDENDSDPIEIALYQLLELFLTLYGNEVKINSELAVYLCITSTFLTQQQYRRYVENSDQYIMEVEDEGEANVRNKAIYFLQQMLENQKQSKKCRKMLMHYIQEILANPTTLTNSITQFLSTFSLPSSLLAVPQLYVESALLILYSFTDQLVQNELQVSMVLGNSIQSSPPNSIEAVLSATVLNKLVKKQPNSKGDYLLFLRSMSSKFADNIGMLIALMRGFYSFSSESDLIIAEEGSAVPFLLVRNLLSYLSRNDSAQLQSGYLILEFLLHLLKQGDNKPILQQLINSESQLYLLKTYINDGITSPLIIDLVVALANPNTISAVFAEIAHGYATDENLPALIGKCIASKAITITEEQLLELCGIYGKRLQMISDIIVAFLEVGIPRNEQLIGLLNAELRPRWLSHLIRYELLYNLKDTLLACIRNIIDNITSPSQLENQLVLPYSLFLRNAAQTIELLSHEHLFLPFCNKLYDYAKLFKGTHLRITTLNVFAAIAVNHKEWIPKTLELFSSYGTIESNEWEDEEDDERIINKYLCGIVNEEVERAFKDTFGELAWDSAIVEKRISQLRQLV